MMRILVLGAAAGGGYPQWNCNTPGSRRAWREEGGAKRRSQASIAVSADGVMQLVSPQVMIDAVERHLPPSSSTLA